MSLPDNRADKGEVGKSYRSGFQVVWDEFADSCAKLLRELGAALKTLGIGIMKVVVILLALAFTVGIGFGVFALYTFFASDFDRPLTLNILGEGVLILFAGVIGISLVVLVWTKVNEITE